MRIVWVCMRIPAEYFPLLGFFDDVNAVPLATKNHDKTRAYGDFNRCLITIITITFHFSLKKCSHYYYGRNCTFLLNRWNCTFGKLLPADIDEIDDMPDEYNDEGM